LFSVVIIVAPLDLILFGVVFLNVESMEGFLVFLEKFFYPYELPLEVDFYGFASIHGVAISTIPPYNLTTTNVVTQWALLTKQWDF
jgi:hypothetical protein